MAEADKTSYLERVANLATHNQEYQWLVQYLDRNHDFISQRLKPVLQGSTRVIIADFSVGSPHLSISNFDTSADFNRLPDALSKRDELTHVRLVFVTSVSGVSDTARQTQLSQVNIDNSNDCSEARIPILTRPQSAGRQVMIDGKEVKHPIQGHNSCLPDPDALKHVGLNLDLSPEMLMRHLDERAHLAYRPRTEIPLWRKSCFLETPDRTELRIAVNQANHLSVVVDPSYIPTGEITDTGPKKFKINTGRNVLILAAEDNCLGIDFNPHVLASDQILRPDDLASDGQREKQAVYQHFEAALREFGPAECIEIISDPGKLIWIYARALSLAFSCHLELCHRQWNAQVELFAKTAESGNATNQENVRILAKEYGLHLRYINSTLDNLKRHRKVASNIDSLVDPCIFNLEGLIADFEHFARELEILKKSYESLLRDQDSRNPLEALSRNKGTNTGTPMQDDSKTKGSVAAVLPLPRHLRYRNGPEISSSALEGIVNADLHTSESLGSGDTPERLGVKSGGVGTAKPLKYPKQKTAGREKGGKWTTSRSQRKEVLSLLSSPVDHEARHEDIRHKRHPETGGWLFKTKSYQEWLQGSATVLWCHGTLGAGKTFLTSIIIDDLVNRFEYPSGNSAVVYAYCHRRDGIVQTPENIVAALLKQILEHRRPACDSVVESLHESHVTEVKSLTLLDMQASIILAAQEFEHVYIILDELEECDETQRKKIFSFIQHLSEARILGQFKVLVTSRPHPMDICHSFKTALKLKISADHEDMTAVIRAKIELKIAQGVIISPEFANEIVEVLLQRAEGMFLFVDSQVNHILLHPTPKMKKDALHRHDNLKDLSAVYILEMERINRLEPTQKKIALDTLSLVADATRPLNLSGLQLALAFEGGDSKVDDDALVDPVTVNNLCGGLVVFDETLAIRLLNFSVEKYLESLNMTAASAHCKLASACLNYLSLGVVQSGACSSEGDVQISHLFDYAARNWGHHWRLSGETDPLLLPKALSLLTSNKSFDPMSRVFFSPTGTTHHGQDHGGQRPLHFLSRCGLLITINALAQWYNNQYYNEQNRYRGRQYSGQSYNTQSYSVHISVKDSGGRTPVSWAAENAQDGAVQQLATSGADIISGDNSGRTPLIYSAQKGHYAVVQVLLGYYNNSGSDINESDKSNLTALHHAAQNGHASIVQLLLEKGAQIVVDDNDEQEALRQAVYKKQYESTAARLIQLFTPKVTNIPCSNDR